MSLLYPGPRGLFSRPVTGLKAASLSPWPLPSASLCGTPCPPSCHPDSSHVARPPLPSIHSFLDSVLVDSPHSAPVHRQASVQGRSSVTRDCPGPVLSPSWPIPNHQGRIFRPEKQLGEWKRGAEVTKDQGGCPHRGPEWVTTAGSRGTGPERASTPGGCHGHPGLSDGCCHRLH